jgi:hypothetical protein
MFGKLKKILFLRLQTTDDSLAQQVEHLPFKQRVPSSSLGRITTKPFLFQEGLFCCTKVKQGEHPDFSR